jgi:hypothetical protein
MAPMELEDGAEVNRNATRTSLKVNAIDAFSASQFRFTIADLAAIYDSPSRVAHF